MLGNINTDLARDAWNVTPGHSTALEYNANNKVTKIIFMDNGDTVFVQNFTYDANGNCILITCTES
jgi:hypothetical protein